MYPQSQNLGNDGESLQTDVMRFMAIIGFCLIAILALVRNVEPTETAAAPAAEQTPVPTEVPQPPPTQPATWKTVVQATPEPVSPPVVPPPVLDPPEQKEPAPQQPEPIEEIVEAVPAPESELETAQATPETEPAPEAAEETAEETAEEEGLVLRFASDGDFLRLIAKGDIQVYAFQETDVLTLNESYRFLDTQSPGQVYELLRPSIPGLIVDALRQARHDIDGFRWGIALPGRISNQIERHLGKVSGGQLVIDRYGEVHHVAAS